MLHSFPQISLGQDAVALEPITDNSSELNKNFPVPVDGTRMTRNLYFYVRNRAASNIDPSGQEDEKYKHPSTAETPGFFRAVWNAATYPFTHPLSTTGAAMSVSWSLITLNGYDAAHMTEAYNTSASLGLSFAGQNEYGLALKTTAAGGSTVLNQLTFEKVKYFEQLEDGTWKEIGLNNSGWHTGSKVFAIIGREAAIAALTAGNSQLARGGTLAKGPLADAINFAARSSRAVKAAQIIGKGLLIYDVGSGSYQVGTGAVELADDPRNLGGWLDVLGGTLRVGGGFLSAREMGVFEHGGRPGSPLIRNQNAAITANATKRGWVRLFGGGRGDPEEYIAPLSGRRGGGYPDITLQKGSYTLRINTVTMKRTIISMMTDEEERAAARIRNLTGEHLLTIPKENVTMPWNHSILPVGPFKVSPEQ